MQKKKNVLNLLDNTDAAVWLLLVERFLFPKRISPSFINAAKLV